MASLLGISNILHSRLRNIVTQLVQQHLSHITHDVEET